MCKSQLVQFENFIVVIRCKNYPEKQLLGILLQNILLSRLSSVDEVV